MGVFYRFLLDSVTAKVLHESHCPVWTGAHLEETLVGIAIKEIAQLQREVGTQADVIIDSGNVPELLNRAAERAKADVLVLGHSPGRSHLGDNGEGYGIIRESHVPVLSV